MSPTRHDRPSGAHSAAQDDGSPTDQLATIQIPSPRPASGQVPGDPPTWQAGPLPQPAPGGPPWGRPTNHRATRPRSRHRPYWIGAGAIGAVLLITIAAAVTTSRTASSPGTSTLAEPAPVTTLQPSQAPPPPLSASAGPTSTRTAAAPAPQPRPNPQPRIPAARPQPKPAPGGCNSNYSGCVPIASDVDCEDGGGNGPAYLSESVRVTGSDVYGLDADEDGTACE